MGEAARSALHVAICRESGASCCRCDGWNKGRAGAGAIFDAVREDGMNRMEFLSDPNVAMQEAATRTAFDPGTAAPGDALDVVFIEGFSGSTVIGIDDNELHTPQPVRLNLAIGVRRLQACHSDRIEDTINYASVRAALHHLLASHRLQLLEALAEAIACLAISEFGAQWVRVSLAKPGKFADVDAVGVVIERRRRDRQPSGALFRSLGEGSIPN
jgi:dihydroneopterin aldolase